MGVYEECVMMMLKEPQRIRQHRLVGLTAASGDQHPVPQVRQALHGAGQGPLGNRQLQLPGRMSRSSSPSPAQASGHNIAPSLPDLTEDDIADYLGNNSARLFGIVTP